MKICPLCQTEYDDAIRFCPKDGTPLIDSETPEFSEEKAGEEVTIIRHSHLKADPEEVITSKPKKIFIQPENIESASIIAPQQQSNVVRIIIPTVFVTIIVFLFGFIFGYFFATRSAVRLDNSNQNTNTNTENINANIKTSPTKTPTPSPTPLPTPSPTPSQTPTNTNINQPSPTASPTVKPTPSPILSPSPEPKPSPTQLPDAGILNSRAINLPKPTYPTAARQEGASGPVIVKVVIDENGNVVSAKAIRGHPLLRSAAEAAAIQSKFTPFSLEGKTTKASGIILYSFVLQ
jgi:TonB family protein